MTLHLPYSESPEDEFQMPDGAWTYSLRALVPDGWLYWQHALPAEAELRARLDWDAVRRITVLASALHLAHQRFPGYSELVDTPFTVSHWWDPSDTGGGYDSGQQVLLRMDGFDAAAIDQQLRSCRHLERRLISRQWIEISLLHRRPPPGAAPA